LPHNFIGKNYVFALLRREVCFCLITVEQDSRTVVGESGFAFSGKMTEYDAIGDLISSGLDDLVIFFIENEARSLFILSSNFLPLALVHNMAIGGSTILPGFPKPSASPPTFPSSKPNFSSDFIVISEWISDTAIGKYMPICPPSPAAAFEVIVGGNVQHQQLLP
jgi:hypothetical protein